MKNHTKLMAVALLSLIAACKGKTATDSNIADTNKTQITKTDSSTVQNSVSSNAGIIKSANFEIQVPTGWTNKEDNMNGRSMFFLLAPVEMNYQTNINILKDPMKGENLDDYIKISLGKMQSMQVVMGPTGSFTANGITGKYLKYIYNAKERQIAVKSYVFPKNDTAYIVTATTLPQLGRKYEPVFDKAVSTLKIN